MFVSISVIGLFEYLYTDLIPIIIIDTVHLVVTLKVVTYSINKN